MILNLSKSTRIPECINLNGRFRNTSLDKAERFNKYFSDQFSSPSTYDHSSAVRLFWSEKYANCTLTKKFGKVRKSSTKFILYIIIIEIT